MFKYKNKTNSEQLVPGVGLVKAGGEVTSRAPIENPNFEYVGEVENTNNSVVGTQAQQPGAVAQANKVSETPETEVN